MQQHVRVCHCMHGVGGDYDDNDDGGDDIITLRISFHDNSHNEPLAA